MAPKTKIVVESWQLDDLFILCVLSLASQEKESWRGGTVKKKFPLKAEFIWGLSTDYCVSAQQAESGKGS